MRRQPSSKTSNDVAIDSRKYGERPYAVPATTATPAFECRINAEDSETFAASPGRITEWDLPGGFGVRVDSHAGAGYCVPPYYDSMIAKLIVHGADREDALARMRLALSEMHVGGIQTNLKLHRRLVDDAGFRRGQVDIHHLERLLAGSA